MTNNFKINQLVNLAKIMSFAFLLLAFTFQGCGFKDIPSKADIPRLIRKLHSKDWRERSAAATYLSYIGPEAKEAIPDLIVALNDAHWHVREAAARALGEISSSPNAIEALAKSLVNDSKPDVRAQAATSLMIIGEEAKVVAPQLIEALNDRDMWVRTCVAGALGNIGPEQGVVEALTRVVEVDVYLVRTAAVTALVKLGPAAESALPKLKELGQWDAVIKIEASLKENKVP